MVYLKLAGRMNRTFSLRLANFRLRREFIDLAVLDAYPCKVVSWELDGTWGVRPGIAALQEAIIYWSVTIT